MALRDPIDDCVHCGFCLPVCPTYISYSEEMDSPRGRIDLMRGVRQRGLPLDATVVTHFDRCLGCMACVTACPSGVRYDVLIEEMRESIEKQHERSGEDRLHRELLFALFPYPGRLRVMLFLLFLYAKSGVRWLLRKTGLLRRLGRRWEQLEAMLPPIHAGMLTASAPRSKPATGELRAHVGLLTGCVQRVFFPEVNQATVRVLSAEGCAVQVPQGQGCCGALSLHAGRAEEARRLLRDLIPRFEGTTLDAIVVNAAGCGSHLKHCARLFAGDEEWAARAEAFAGKVRDVSELVVALGPVALRHPLPVTVAYHDACHLAHAQGIRQQPRALLRSIPGLDLREIPDGDQCCGSAGIYNLIQPDSADQVGRRKLANVLSVGAAVIASANPGCTLQMQKLAGERGIALRAAHPVEILDASLRGDTQAWTNGKPAR